MYLCQDPKDFLIFWKQFTYPEGIFIQTKRLVFLLGWVHFLQSDVFRCVQWIHVTCTHPATRLRHDDKTSEAEKKVTCDWFAGLAITGVVMVTSLQRFQISRNHARMLGTAKKRDQASMLAASAVGHVLTRLCHPAAGHKRQKRWSNNVC